jgi:hypothetical protein
VVAEDVLQHRCVETTHMLKRGCAIVGFFNRKHVVLGGVLQQEGCCNKRNVTT